jgi:hypothetical protein
MAVLYIGRLRQLRHIPLSAASGRGDRDTVVVLVDFMLDVQGEHLPRSSADLRLVKNGGPGHPATAGEPS